MPKVEETIPKPRVEKEGYSTVELGVRHNMPFTYWNRDDKRSLNFPRMEEVNVRDLIRMRQTDGQVRALVRLLTLPIRASARDMQVIGDEGGEAERQFIEDVFMSPEVAGGMMHTFDHFIAQTLQALVEGFKAFELIYKIPSRGPMKGKITYHKLACRPGEMLTFLVDKKTGDFTGLRQQGHFGDKHIDIIIPKDKCFVYTANSEENPFYGVSYFLPAYYHWDKKVKIYYLTHLAAQHRAVPGRVAITKPNLPINIQQDITRALSNYGLGASMQFGEDLVESIDEWGKSQPTFNYVELINHHNAQMSKSVLAQFLDSQDSNTTMINTTSDDQDEMFVLELASIINEIVNEINEVLIPRLIDWNFGTETYPKVEFRPVTQEQKDALVTMFGQLATAPGGADVTPTFMYEIEKEVAQALGIPVDYEVTENFMEEERMLEVAKAQAEVEKLEADTEATKRPDPAPVMQPSAPA